MPLTTKTVFLFLLVLSSISSSYSAKEQQQQQQEEDEDEDDVVQGSHLTPEQQYHQDSRCVCKCPDVKLVLKDSKQIVVDVGGSSVRSVYINASVTPQECNCEHIVLLRLNLTVSQADSFCPRCKCTFQSRNLTIIKVVVILVLWIISILVIYMAFLTCLEPILSKRLAGINYRQQRNNSIDTGGGGDSDQEDMEGGGGPSSMPGGSSGSSSSRGQQMAAVMSRVGNTQIRWKKQVQEQRRHIYDRHTMLN